jgi:hypothetical protein
MSYTYTILEVSEQTFNEIKVKLEKAGYFHSFRNSGQTIDIHGIALESISVHTPNEPLIEGHSIDCKCSECGHEWLKANLEA